MLPLHGQLGWEPCGVKVNAAREIGSGQSESEVRGMSLVKAGPSFGANNSPAECVQVRPVLVPGLVGDLSLSLFLSLSLSPVRLSLSLSLLSLIHI